MATSLQRSPIARVLPWRRNRRPASAELAPLFEAFEGAHPNQPIDVIVRAFERSREAHARQVRKSGEPYITHPLAVATILAGLGMDESTIVAGLLHDVVEDTDVQSMAIAAEFGATVANLVDGVTKLDKIEFETKEARTAASMRKMLVAMSEDPRVLVIKLADRLHNMRTLAALPDEQQERTARETKEIYAPLAHRMGMSELKQQLEDLSFAVMEPKIFAEIDALVADRDPERETYLAQIEVKVMDCLQAAGVRAEIVSRPKHFYSIYEKMVHRGKGFDEIFDLVGIRILVENTKDCYAALGAIHAMWPPINGRFKDYIAQPKNNMYQSLHTSVVADRGQFVELQIRTFMMHRRAEDGVAAHYAYKEGRLQPSSELGWLREMVEFQEEVSDPKQFMEELKRDLGLDFIYVFTPKGDVKELPIGSTPIDFAYAIHTEVGHRAVSARVNGKLVPLSTRLGSGDTVAIVTSKNEQGPTLDWLQFVVSRTAQSRIRQWFARERREDALEAGRELLIRALRRESLPVQRVEVSPALAQVAVELRFHNVDAMLTAIGTEHMSAEAVASRVAKRFRGVQPGMEEIAATPKARPRPLSSSIGIHVDHQEDIAVRLAQCCGPFPPDPIMGFVTRGRGISVHHANCSNAVTLAAGNRDRVVDVNWADNSSGTVLAAIEIRALDRERLLADITRVLSDQNVNILQVGTKTQIDTRIATMRFEFEAGDWAHVETMLTLIRQVDSVYDAEKVQPFSDLDT